MSFYQGPEEMDIAIDELRNEIDDLEAALEAEKDKYSSMSDHMIAVERQFKIKSSMKMLPDEACYLISLEIPIPLDVVAVQSTVSVSSVLFTHLDFNIFFTCQGSGDVARHSLQYGDGFSHPFRWLRWQPPPGDVSLHRINQQVRPACCARIALLLWSDCGVLGLKSKFEQSKVKQAI